ncbi:MAG: type II and III secretion system protein [Gammaproteobacteria bacterium]|nr:MAG: type II and III secretion system protein [Gammaproteobacteria bacterium]
MRSGAALVLVSLLAGCQGIAPEPRPISQAHLNTTPPPTPAASSIPAPVLRTPFVPKPVAEPSVETYTVVVNDVPVKELLFALARDAAINVDIHPDVSGLATLNAVDQSLLQILDRLARQLDLRYEINGDNISIRLDTPFVRMYRVDYVNLTREATTTSTVSTEIASTSTSAGDGGGGGGNNSSTTVTSSTSYPFWDTLAETLRNLVSGSGTFEGLDEEETVIVNAANGIVIVRATGSQHEEVQRYLDEVRAASRRQVLIEVTIVEVQLSDNYSAGIDWSSLASDAGLSVIQDFAGGVAQGLGASPFFALTYANSRDPTTGAPDGDLTASVRLLKQFGDTRVLSSPKVMALNNQTALLKVVQNIVYFEVSSNTSQAQTTSVTSFSTEARSVSVGVVMSVTPQINETDEVTLIIRPTISRVISRVQDPNPDLINAITGETIPNLVPEIAVREMESVLRIGSGQLAILGGLMTDDVKKNSDAIPWLSESETFGDLFTSRNNEFVKTELVIFIRPWVIRTPDVQADLKSFEPFLPENIDPVAEPVTSRFAKDLP